ncbi:N-acetyltransferase [Bremerella cremea]|uniref:N-acetyltransferase n=1 Tax=Bremerella cremea TaxID=1031537 RepID=A0A368KQ20_9BACT|nr:GNAT family N-acetyltransferase [Bremerella cremea]RCS47763.1 N-acetyltransferase [Bremerella cremea]
MVIDVGNGIVLSAFRADDTEVCTGLLQEAEIHRGLSLMPNPYRQEDFERWLAFVTAEAERFGRPLQFAIRDQSGTFLGGCGASQMVVGHKCEIGYWLGKPTWGRGIMTAVVESLCNYLQRDFQLVRIAATVFEGNLASMRVLEKNGFAREACLRKYYLKKERYIDGQLFAKVW